MSSSSFIGQAQTAIDEKGRSSFPREFRRQLSEADGKEFVITRAPVHILKLYTRPEYEKFKADLALRCNRRQATTIIRNLASTLVELDGQNRILIPRKLLEYADLKGEVLYSESDGKTLELWNPTRFNEEHDLSTDEANAQFEADYYGESLTEVQHEKT